MRTVFENESDPSLDDDAATWDPVGDAYVDPSYIIDTDDGIAIRVPAAYVVRDNWCPYPLTPDMWAYIVHEGWNTQMSAQRVVRCLTNGYKALECLFPKTIVVVSDGLPSEAHEGQPRCFWCVRLMADAGGRNDGPMGERFLWPLAGCDAMAFHRKLQTDRRYASHVLVTSLVPEPHWDAHGLTSAIRRAHPNTTASFSRVVDRLFAAAVAPCGNNGASNDTAHTNVRGDSRAWPPWWTVPYNAPAAASEGLVLRSGAVVCTAIDWMATLPDDVHRHIWSYVVSEALVDYSWRAAEQLRRYRSVDRKTLAVVREHIIGFMVHMRQLLQKLRGTPLAYMALREHATVCSGMDVFACDEADRVLTACARQRIVHDAEVERAYWRLRYGVLPRHRAARFTELTSTDGFTERRIGDVRHIRLSIRHAPPRVAGHDHATRRASSRTMPWSGLRMSMLVPERQVEHHLARAGWER